MLRVARETIERGLAGEEVWLPSLEGMPEPLCALGASFVTLYSVQRREEGRVLRGCVGSLDARRPLLQDVAHNAYYSAFQDARFAPLCTSELASTELELSILSPLVELPYTDEPDLLRQLVVAKDGLAIEYATHRATFLPSVWEQLPDVNDFWLHLKRKAGLAADFWHPQLRCWRYRVLKIREADAGNGERMS
ncbi:AmmeMemoRadiSam system protein A [Marinobacterium rhizophilum]|uniref:AmmeMemoRadiSam system protein A n=1 Tax=Marinobacterium rhizophilum TaxID=420402 RepID=A0ABY5HN22_9GAMM|nr:AmmeMemoRadiSam system protein A [Marinobacterium rhizophilum]